MTDAPKDNRETGLQVEKLERPIDVGDSGIVLHDANDVWGIAKGIHSAGMAPRSLDSADKIAVAILTGAEAGLSPMMSIRSIYVINGAPAWLTKAARALVLNSGLLKPGTSIQEGVIHLGDCPRGEKADERCSDDCYGYCRTHRNGEAVAREHKFTVGDARRARLWDKKGKHGPGVWQLYPDRMLMHRAAGFHFDDCWSELLMGLTTVEVLQDHPPAAFVREREGVATYTEAPGRDPLLARASGAIDVEHEEISSTGEPGAAPAASEDGSSPDSTPSEASDSPQPMQEGEASASPPVAEGPDAPASAPASPDPVQEEGAGNGPKGEEDCLSVSDGDAKPPPAVDAIDAGTAPAPPSTPDPPVYAALCEKCGTTFDPDSTHHWNYGGVFRCAECGPRVKE